MRQRGFVVLTLILIVLSASSFVMLKALNESTVRQARHDTETKQALMLAKSALMGYALAYPDGPGGHPMAKGPGYLPCPDHVAAGTPGSADNVPDCVV
ncbi:MAG: hypothetical protein O7H40_10240, partial [Gammaproteobacteria bacterium]|nr:hypothetical protein [Gammaproteobacteria bacterium]